MKTVREQRTQFPNDVRYNWGYWDGQLAYQMHQGYRYTHFDKHYLAGWQEGYEEAKCHD